MYSARTLTEHDAQEISEAYFKASKDPRKIAEHLGVPTFDLGLIRHPLVKRLIAQKATRLRRSYTLDDHLTKLKQIRDAALSDSNYKVALTAEIAVGKAAGLYEKIVDESAGVSEVENLSTEQIRQKIANLTQPVLPAPEDELLIIDPKDFPDDEEREEYEEGHEDF